MGFNERQLVFNNASIIKAKRAEKERKREKAIRKAEQEAKEDDDWRERLAQHRFKPQEDVPFGSWQSPFSSDLVTASIELQEIAIDRTQSQTRLYWLQRQYFDAAAYSPLNKERDAMSRDPFYRGSVFSVDLDADGSASEPVEWTRAPYKVQTNVHSTQLHDYWAIRNMGGSISGHDGCLYFATKHNLYCADQPGSTEYLSLALGPNWRFAEPTIAHGAVYCIHEVVSLKSADKGKPPQNRLVRLCPNRTERKQAADRFQYTYPELLVISDDADFYASPQISPDGRTLVWMQWSHPNMPWQATEIWSINLDVQSGTPLTATKRKILGDGKTCYMQPRWSPNGSLYVIADTSDWWNIYEVDIANAKLNRNVARMHAEIGAPMWRLGSFAQSYDFDPRSTKMAFEADGKLHILNLSESSKTIQIHTGYARHRSVYFGNNSDIYCIASGPTKPQCLIRYSLATENVTIIVEADNGMKHLAERRGIDWSRYMSAPEHLSISVEEGKEPNDFFTGFYYSPKNDDYAPLTGQYPPLIIYLHDGPTDQKTDEFDSRIFYFTSRGFAWFSINYRGSSGYGRSYRDNLNGHWGRYEVEDAITAAKYLAKKNMCDPSSIFLFGESAGGFSAMRAACAKDIFRGAMIHYGYCDLVSLHKRANFGQESKQVGMLKDADKFRAHYWSRLGGEYDLEACTTLKALSPLTIKDEIACPIGIIYGLDDKMSRGGCHDYDEIWKCAREKGYLTTMLEFYDEGHGFQKPANQRLSLDGTYAYFCKLLEINATLADEGHGFQKPANQRLSLDGTYAYFCKLLEINATVKCGRGDGDPKERVSLLKSPLCILAYS
uniref:Peptidase S9 prolyl oligopeptidase catalytic domain-containing protein n=1 Tax=Plectus sambesii TaxID=2011161 RepID=A0A914W7K8_9BILA